MEKLVFNKKNNSWNLKKSGSGNYPDPIFEFGPLLNLFKAARFFYLRVHPQTGQSTCSDGVRDVLGFNPEVFDDETLHSLIHPEDLPAVELFTQEADEFLEAQSAAQKLFCKVQYTFRIKSAGGQYKHVMLQKVHDARNQSSDEAYVLVITDLSKLRMNVEPSLSMVHFKRGHSLISSQKSVEPLPDLTERQWQVLKTMIELCDVEIAAERLGITTTTVRNHLGLIRQKIQAKSMVHMLAMAEEKKWFAKLDEERRDT